MSVSIILQNLAQLKALFEKQWESIVGNADEFLYLGGNEQSTHKFVSATNLYQLDVTKSDDLSVVHVKFGKTPDKLMNGQREIGTVRHDFFLHCMVIMPKIRDR